MPIFPGHPGLKAHSLQTCCCALSPKSIQFCYNHFFSPSLCHWSAAASHLMPAMVSPLGPRMHAFSLAPNLPCRASALDSPSAKASSNGHFRASLIHRLKSKSLSLVVALSSFIPALISLHPLKYEFALCCCLHLQCLLPPLLLTISASLWLPATPRLLLP